MDLDLVNKISIFHQTITFEFRENNSICQPQRDIPTSIRANEIGLSVKREHGKHRLKSLSIEYHVEEAQL